MAEATPTKTSATLTAREQAVVVAALQSLKGGNIEIDYTELCNKLGLKGEASARASWHSVKKKLFEGQAMSDTTAKPKTPRKAATPRAKKTISKATVAAEDDEDEAVADATSPGDVEADAGADAGADDGGDGTGTATQDAPTTPKKTSDGTPTTSTGKKRTRKTKAEKEAEAAANEDNDDEEDKDKPAKKPRKTPVKKAGAVPGDDKDGEPTTPAKAKRVAKPRKQSSTHAATSATAPAVVEDMDEATKARKEKIAAQAAEANELLAGKKLFTSAPASKADILNTGALAEPAKTQATGDGASAEVADDSESQTVAVVQTEVVTRSVDVEG